MTAAIIDAIDDTPKANIIADIVAHPKEMPSQKEIDYMNPSLDSSTISEHLSKLESEGVIKSVRSDQGREFYYVTEDAQELFDQHGLFAEDVYQDAYEQVTKPKEIREAETAPRPDQIG